MTGVDVRPSDAWHVVVSADIPELPPGPLFPPGGAPGFARLLTVDSSMWARWSQLVPGLGSLSLRGAPCWGG